MSYTDDKKKFIKCIKIIKKSYIQQGYKISLKNSYKIWKQYSKSLFCSWCSMPKN
jgi:hypothetical protein